LKTEQTLPPPLALPLTTAVSSETKKPNHPVYQGNPVSLSVPRQPGYLIETRGFPSPPHEGFGIVVGLFIFLLIKNKYKKMRPFCISVFLK
jgi:hypothetical protein